MPDTVVVVAADAHNKKQSPFCIVVGYKMHFMADRSLYTYAYVKGVCVCVGCVRLNSCQINFKIV